MIEKTMLIRNLIIFSLMAGYFYLIIHKLRKGDGLSFKFVVFVVITFFSFILPNISVVISPFTPKIKGRVTDYETQQPIANCNIIASWEIRTIAFPEWGRNNIYHQFSTKTDANGEYQIPRYMKPLTMIDIGVFKNWFGGIHVVAFTHGYSIGGSGIDEQGKRSSFDMSLNAHANPESVDLLISSLEEIFNSKNYKKRSFGQHLSNRIMSYDEITQDDKQYILEECKILDARLKERVKTHKYRDTMNAMETLGRYYEKLGEHKAAGDVRKRTNEIFPDRDKVKSFVSDENIQLFKKMRRGSSPGSVDTSNQRRCRNWQRY